MTVEDPKVIYLGPACQKEGDGREWCEDDAWPKCECGCSSVRYVLESDAQSELAALREENKKVQKRYEDMTDRAVEFEAAAESAELGVSLGLQREAALREELDGYRAANMVLRDELKTERLRADAAVGDANDAERSLAAAEQRNAAVHKLSPEAYSVVIGMVEHCLNIRACMGMDEGYNDYENEESEHDFVKEIRAFVAASNKPTESGASE